MLTRSAMRAEVAEEAPRRGVARSSITSTSTAAAEHEHEEESRTMSCNGDRDPHAFDGKKNRAIPMTADE